MGAPLLTLLIQPDHLLSPIQEGYRYSAKCENIDDVGFLHAAVDRLVPTLVRALPGDGATTLLITELR
jgi:hypothetical protein